MSNYIKNRILPDGRIFENGLAEQIHRLNLELLGILKITSESFLVLEFELIEILKDKSISYKSKKRLQALRAKYSYINKKIERFNIFLSSKIYPSSFCTIESISKQYKTLTMFLYHEIDMDIDNVETNIIKKIIKNEKKTFQQLGD